MNISRRTIISEAGDRLSHGGHNGTQRGLQRVVQQASHRIAARRATVLTEHEAEQAWFWKLVKLELERARRREESFSVLCVEYADAAEALAVARRLPDHVRDTDAVIAEGDRVLILLGDTIGEGARAALQRLGKEADLQLHRAAWREVSFPRDALTIGALIECLLCGDVNAPMLAAG